MTGRTETPDTKAELSANLLSVALIGICGAGIAGLASTPRTGLGVLVGAAIAVGNLWAMARIVRAFLYGTARRLPWVIIATAKLVVLVGGGLALLESGIVDGFALAIGYAALPLGIVFAQLRTDQTSEEIG